ncbi:hypothetical protein P7266_0815 [Lactococcus cremoris]|nr:hypothetical protein P7266_0815 [Lactococcus cremoris]
MCVVASVSINAPPFLLKMSSKLYIMYDYIKFFFSLQKFVKNLTTICKSATKKA